MADLGGFLAREFARRGWSVRRAARELNIDRSTLGKLLRNATPRTIQGVKLS